MRKSYLLFSITVICIVVISQFAYPAPGLVSLVYACSTWQVGQRVGLRGGSEIRHGSGLGYGVHTIVPEDHWQVDIIEGPRNADGFTWWNISRQNLDGGGTGWVYIEQAVIDVCGNDNNPPPSNPPAGFSFCAKEGDYCSFSGTGDVAYGAQGSFFYAYGVSGGIHCSNGSFGDPIYGVPKACYFKQTSSSVPISSPSLSSPGNGTSWPKNTSIVLQWNSSANATQYKVELWGGTYTAMTPCNWQPGTSCTIGEMWPGTMYWKAKARDSNGRESDWSATWSFTIQDIQQPVEPPSQPPSNPQPPANPAPSNPQPPSNSPQPSNPQQPPNPQPPSNDPSQADACPGFVKKHIPGLTTPPTGRYVYVPADIDVLRLRQSYSTEACVYGWLTPQHYYSVLQERNDGWIQIETSVSQGWIMSQYVDTWMNEQQSLPPPDMNAAPESPSGTQPNPNTDNQSETNTSNQEPNSEYVGLIVAGGSIAYKDFDGKSPSISPSSIEEDECIDDRDYIATFKLEKKAVWNNVSTNNIYIDTIDTNVLDIGNWLLWYALWSKGGARILDDDSGFRDQIKLCISNRFISESDAQNVRIWLDE